MYWRSPGDGSASRARRLSWNGNIEVLTCEAPPPFSTTEMNLERQRRSLAGQRRRNLPRICSTYSGQSQYGAGTSVQKRTPQEIAVPSRLSDTACGSRRSVVTPA